MAQSSYGFLVASPPAWPGSFYSTAKCDRNRCCCFDGLITLSRVGSKQLRLVTQVNGAGCPPNRYIDTTINLPTSFGTVINLFGGLVDVKLSSDSRIIDVFNQAAPLCSGSAVRS
ncbi:unnamed protein product [Rotaria sordida]|uniref:Uncharacterized protein n=1 Tax=Rotaria sordida TaxID=392033 RepID=A0A814P758_9BILA|nr:unnamed protein product [Rotaria sordida]CAF0997128.1 unnamed protein product [Rotaria sordida]CAF1103881.1 unnamed protein product [Rotaria sordida]CAF1111304.1 unnamed protein product [Rotaria sordida]CAF3585852.1 unnamed protein product [Rotaria sordida]